MLERISPDISICRGCRHFDGDVVFAYCKVGGGFSMLAYESDDCDSWVVMGNVVVDCPYLLEHILSE
jgi:hypothetical protein